MKANAIRPWILRATALLFVFEAATGYWLYLDQSYSRYEQVLEMLHLALGMPFILVVAYFISNHLNKTLRRKNAGWWLLALTAIGTAFFLTFNNQLATAIKLAAIVIFFNVATTWKRAAFAVIAVAVIALMNPFPKLQGIIFEGKTADLALLSICWLAYIWVPFRRKQALSDKIGQNLLGVVSSVALGLLMCTGILLFAGWGLYYGGNAAGEFHSGAGLILPVAALAHVVYFLGLRHSGKVINGLKAQWKPIVICAAATVGVMAVAWPCSLMFAKRVGPKPVYAGYSQKFENPLFGPSEARTVSGKLIESEALTGSKSCAAQNDCHPGIYRQWEASAHRKSSTGPIFPVLFGVIKGEKGEEEARFCAGCHMPVDLTAGNINPGQEPRPENMEEGISCIACHAIVEVNEKRGNGSYTVFGPRKGIFEGRIKVLSSQAILAFPTRHLKIFLAPVLKKGRYCASCHKQFVREEMNGFGTVSLQNQYDSWAESDYSKGRNGERARCQDCHMPLLEKDYFNVPFRDHRFLAANMWLPTLDGDKEFVELTKLFLKGRRSEILERAPGGLREVGYRKFKPFPSEDLWPEGPLLDLELTVAPQRPGPGERITIAARTSNRAVGHVFPTGPLDLLQVWMEVRLTDETGKVCYSSGGLDENLHLLPDSIQLGGDEVDENGEAVQLHRVWKFRRVANRREILPGEAIEDNLEIVMPKTASGKLKLSVAWKYRNVPQAVIDLLNQGADPDGKLPTAPVIVLAEAERSIELSGESF